MAALPVVVLIFLLGLDAWVYLDAGRRAAEGHNVVVTIGSLEIGTPVAWFVTCLFLWIVFFPIYLRARQAPA